VKFRPFLRSEGGSRIARARVSRVHMVRWRRFFSDFFLRRFSWYLILMYFIDPWIWRLTRPICANDSDLVYYMVEYASDISDVDRPGVTGRL